MSWRTVQLGHKLCDQDKIIIDLFNDDPVRYVGFDTEFQKKLNIADSAPNLILILNSPAWCSNIVKSCQTHLTAQVEHFYIGINRYTLLGNDTTIKINLTNEHGVNCLKFLEVVVKDLGYSVLKSGTFDNDLGRYFNFVQPLTWMYGTKTANNYI